VKNALFDGREIAVVRVTLSSIDGAARGSTTIHFNLMQLQLQENLMRVPSLLLIAAIGSLSLAAHADNIQTVGQYTSPNISTGPFPLAAVTIGSFDILSGDSAITLSGTFGNYDTMSPFAEQPTSAVDVYLGDIEVATCSADFMFCSGYDPVPDPWSYTLSAAQIASLGTGTVDLTAVQTAPYVIALGETTLDQATTSTPPPAVTPEPSSFLLLGTGLLSIGGALRRRFV
jgi:hypothetical protein